MKRKEGKKREIELLSFPHVEQGIVVDDNPLEVFVDEGIFVVDKVVQLKEGGGVEERTILMRDGLEAQSCRKSAKRTHRGEREVKREWEQTFGKAARDLIDLVEVWEGETFDNRSVDLFCCLFLEAHRS